MYLQDGEECHQPGPALTRRFRCRAAQVAIQYVRKASMHVPVNYFDLLIYVYTQIVNVSRVVQKAECSMHERHSAQKAKCLRV